METEIPKNEAKVLHEYFSDHRREILSLTRALVESESPSGDEAGSKAVTALISAAARTIPAVTSVERVPSEKYGEHLRIKAFGNGDSNDNPIVILGHTDTVHPRGSLKERPWRIEGNRAYGPGVFDMKANCALAIEAIRACIALNLAPRHPVVLLLTCDEEQGSISGRSLVEAQAKRSRAVLVIEPPASGGRVKTGRKGTGIFTLETRGRAAHAGLEPEKGASAVLEMARQIQTLHELNKKGGGISVNVGVVHGGTVSNVVAAQARAEIDVRFSSSQEAKLIEECLASLRPFDERVQVILGGEINRPPMERSDKVLELYRHACNIAATIDYDLGEAQVGGASDGNFAAAVGASVLDGLGIDGDGAHAVHEHIIIDDIPKRGALLAGLLATL
jgi:glutamate carboxypeptidase